MTSIRSNCLRPGALVAAVVALVTVVGYAPAQAKWTVDAKSTIVWWQMRPHLNHLWATTCPEEPSWRPGDGRTGGSWTSTQGFRAARGSEGYGGATNDTVHIPLWPRHKVRAVCNPEAVRGEFTLADPATLRGLRGEVVVKADALTTASDERDTFARGAILQTSRYPDIRYVIDSVVNVTRRGDTIRATALGSLTIRDVTKPMASTVRVYPLAGGTTRVIAKMSTPAPTLVPEWGLSRFALGLGVGVRIWEDLYMGADMVVRPTDDN